MNHSDRWDDDIPEPTEHGRWLTLVAAAIAVLAVIAYMLLAASLGSH